MMSNVGTRAVHDFERELSRAYDGDVPPPYYWQLPASPPRSHGRRHPGEIATALPYAHLPAQLLHGDAISLEEIDDLLERRARREELGG